MKGTRATGPRAGCSTARDTSRERNIAAGAYGLVGTCVHGYRWIDGDQYLIAVEAATCVITSEG